MSNFIEFKGAKIHFTDSRKGRCIVLLHGFLESLEIWNEQMLSKRYRVVCIDLPGHGKSGNIGYVHTMEMMADCVHEVLHSLQITKTVMFGHSMGGYVALAFAEKYMCNLRGFCLFHSPAAADPEEKKKDRERAIQVVKRNPKILIDELVPNLFAPENRAMKEVEQLKKIALQMTRQGIVNCLEGMKDRKDRTNVLAKTKVPVLQILGKKDAVFNYELLKPQSELSPEIQLLTLENSGHMGYIEQKEECYIAMKRFIRKCHLPLEEGEE